MEELLPVGTPGDWVAIGGVDLFSEYERKIPAVSAKLGLEPAPDPLTARRQVEAICVAAEPIFDRATVPALTTDPDDDLIVWTALSAGADLLISDDKDIVPTDAHGSRFFEHAGNTVLAVRFGYLMEHQLDGVDWAQIDGSMLAQLYRAGAREE